MNINIIQNIPNLQKICLHYIFEDLKIQLNEGELWLEFGVHSGKSINYFGQFTDKNIYGFDSFEGLPEEWRSGFAKGSFNRDGLMPDVLSNIKLIKGWFNESLEPFLASTAGLVSFLHLDADLYSSTKYVLDTLINQNRIKNGCVILFDELLNFPGFLDNKSELRALCEWLEENPHIKWKWIGMNGRVGGTGKNRQAACIKILEI